MTKLVWNQQTSPQYETGVDRGVFYPLKGAGVVWNSLMNVESTFVGGEQVSFHFDGVKYLDLVSAKNYQAVISALNIPPQAEHSIGYRAVVPGFILTRQPRERFGLSYRTLVGKSDYKLHIVYNAMISTSTRQHGTITDSPEPETFSWSIDAIPPVAKGYIPSAHYILDSRKMNPDALDAVEDILYGSELRDPRLPSLGELLDLTVPWNPLYIIPQPITGLSELAPGMGDLYKGQIDGIYRALPDTSLVQTPINGLYRLE